MSERDDHRLLLNQDAGAAAGGGATAPALAPDRERLAGAALDRLELPIEVRLGRVQWRLNQVLDLRVGDGVPVGVEDAESVTLYVQGQPYATGDLLVVEGRFAFRVRELCAGAGGDRRP